CWRALRTHPSNLIWFVPAKGAKAVQDTPQWGIEPVPERLRVLGTLDTTLLWTNLGISLLVLVLPAYFDLPLRDALAATVVGGVIGNGMLAVTALIGADARVPTMVLQRGPLGRRGSYVATGLNVLQCLGWAIFELIVIVTAAARSSASGSGICSRRCSSLDSGRSSSSRGVSSRTTLN